jgi:protease YdgD
MVGKLLRYLAFGVALSAVMVAAADASVIAPLGDHRQDVDETRYPWSAIGKLYNETGASCSGVAIAANKVLTAAHCLYNFRSRRFIAAEALHFLLGYRGGHYVMHARVSSYEVGAGFDPLRYDQTSDADWAILTVTENLPADISPLRLSESAEVSGTKATIVGYPQDRAFAMTADRDCELRQGIDGGKLMLHTCRGVGGYSGAPILVSAGGGDVRIAGIQIAKFNSDGTDKMLAVTAQAIRPYADVEIEDIRFEPDRADRAVAANCPVAGGPAGLAALRLRDIGLSARPQIPAFARAIRAALGVAIEPAFAWAAAAWPGARPPLLFSPLYRTALEPARRTDRFSVPPQFSLGGA